MSAKNVKVTVGMPTYNASQTVREAIESVLKQDYDDFELLIVDDASTDGTFDIVQSYRNDSRVRIYASKKNLGIGATRNRIVKLAKGKYIVPCDNDDLMLAGHLMRFSGFLDSHPKIGVVYGELLVIEVGKERQPYILGKDCNKVWDLLSNSINHPGSMIRKSLIRKVGGYDETVFSVGDWSLWLKLIEIARFQFLEGEIYYVYRRGPKSALRIDKQRLSDEMKLRTHAIKRRYGIQSPSKDVRDNFGNVLSLLSND